MMITRWLFVTVFLSLAAFVQTNPSAAAQINLAGTFNDWSPTNSAYQMTAAGDGVYRLTKFFAAGRYQFKFTFDGGWGKHLGAGRGGMLEQPGREIDLNIKRPGDYRIELDVNTHHWRFEQVPVTSPHSVIVVRGPVELNVPITLDGSESLARPNQVIRTYEFWQDTNDSVRVKLGLTGVNSPQAVVRLTMEGAYHFWLKVNDGIASAPEEATLKPQASYQILGDWTANDPLAPATFMQRADSTRFEKILKSSGPGKRQLMLVKDHEQGNILTNLVVDVTQSHQQFWRAGFDEKSQQFKCEPEQIVEFTYRPGDDPALKGRGPVESVNLAGTFNGWSAAVTPMTDRGDGTYVTLLKLDDGLYQYKFVVNGDTWVQDPNADPSLRVDDGHESFNSGIYVGEQGKDYGPQPMNDVTLAAVRHQPDQERYFNVVSSGFVEIGLRTLQNDAKQVNLEIINGKGAHAIPMQKSGTAVGFDYWIANGFVDASQTNLTYDFKLTDGPTTRMYGAGDSGRTNAVVPFVRPLTVRFPTPEWAKNVVWYQIFPERFRNGTTENDPPHTLPWRWDWYKFAPGETPNDTKTFSGGWYSRRFGGDFQGVIEELPYLHNLGVTALYFCPVFESSSNHGYDTVDYRHISQYFGFRGDNTNVIARETLDPATWQWTPSDKLFLEFIKKAHAQGLKVVIDGVFNHMGKNSFALQDVLSNGVNSVCADWFDVTDWGPPVRYKSWDSGGWMPNFRKDPEKGYASDSAKKYIFDITHRWMDPNGNGDPSDGVDGWRLDVAPDVPAPFWRDWRKQVKGINSNAYITGEDWGVATSHLQGDEWDAVMNYQFAIRAVRYFINQKHKITASEFDRQLRELLATYPMQVNLVMQNLYDSHDTDRLVNMIINPDRDYDQGNRPQNGEPYNGSKPGPDAYRVMKLMATFQMTFLGAPMVWYGDEAGMFGADDPTDRKPMLWKDLEPYDNPQDAVMDDVWNHYARLIAIHNTYPALRTGMYQSIVTDDTNDIFAFTRTLGNEVVAVVINNSAKDQTVDVPVPFPNGTRVVDVLNSPAELYNAPMSNLGFPQFERKASVRAIRVRANAPTCTVRDGKVRLNLPRKSAAILVGQ